MGRPEIEKAFAHIDAHFDSFVAYLSEYLRVPTVSAEGKAFEEGASATVRVLQRFGIEARRYTVKGGPDLVVGSATNDAGLPTLALYNHYDVQPVDPLDEWKTDPFKPEVGDGMLYGRGSGDTKGTMVAQAFAASAVRETLGFLPVNLRFVVDGEEEVGSPHLLPFADAHPEIFRADGATIEGCEHDEGGTPLFTMGSKGILAVELSLRTAEVDQHSSFATVIPNAPWRLIALLNTLKDAKGKIAIPGFYDGAHKPTKEELAYLKKNTWDPGAWSDTYGTEVFGGRTPFERLKAHVYGTTCTIDGIFGGYSGPGSKTVNPAAAGVKLDFRLLPGQRPDDIYDKLLAHLKAAGYGDVTATKHSTFEPAATPASAPISQAVISGMRDAYGKEPNLLPWLAGSSTTWYFTRVGTPAVMAPGVGWVGSRIHAPNENIRLEDARRAIKATAAMMLAFPRGD